MQKTLLQIFLILLVTTIFLSNSVYSEELDDLEQFNIWATEHGIELVGVNKNSIDLYYYGYDSKTDRVDWRQIPGVLSVANALYKVPENVIQVMDGKTIYFSTEYGRSYTVLDSFPEYDILEGLQRGVIIERNFNPHTVIHELGHIVDYHGIQGFYNDDRHIFQDSSAKRNLVFHVTQNHTSNASTIPYGYISAYSTTNEAENFAENFAYYVLYPQEFRERILVDPLLTEEYEFLRDEIFLGLEFE